MAWQAGGGYPEARTAARSILDLSRGMASPPFPKKTKTTSSPRKVLLEIIRTTAFDLFFLPA